MKIHLAELTTCQVATDGECLELGFIDDTGQPASLTMTFESAQAIAMTLPSLLSEAVRRITGERESRYVFPLGGWQVASAADRSCAIATLATPDGFEVTFGIPREACRGLGWALKVEADPERSGDLERSADTSMRMN